MDGTGPIGVAGHGVSTGVIGNSNDGTGVAGQSVNGTGVFAFSTNGMALQVNGNIGITGPVGTATVPAGGSPANPPTVTVTNDAVTSSSIILLTPYTALPPAVTLWISPPTSPGSFTIHATGRLRDPVTVHYLIIS